VVFSCHCDEEMKDIRDSLLLSACVLLCRHFDALLFAPALASVCDGACCYWASVNSSG
jgi:hypothetical protein